jgi:hypothetical protein
MKNIRYLKWVANVRDGQAENEDYADLLRLQNEMIRLSSRSHEAQMIQYINKSEGELRKFVIHIQLRTAHMLTDN